MLPGPSAKWMGGHIVHRAIRATVVPTAWRHAFVEPEVVGGYWCRTDRERWFGRHRERANYAGEWKFIEIFKEIR